MHEIERWLAGLARGSAGDLPPRIAGALRRTRVRRRVLRATPALLAVAVAIGVSLSVPGRPARAGPETVGEALSPVALVSLVRANRDPDPDALRLPGSLAPGAGVMGVRDAHGLAAELAVR